LTYRKKRDNQERLKLLKIGRLKMYESKLQLQIKNHESDKTILQTMKEISQVKSEIQNLQK